MKSIYILSLTTENSLRVLQRISFIFSRNRVNIKYINVFELPDGISSFNIAIKCDNVLIKKIIKQLKNVIELIDINIVNKI